MQMNSPRPARPESGHLALDKPTLLVGVFAALLLVETFSGALRYYFDQAGIAGLLYLPKVACLLAVALELTTQKNPRSLWLVLLAGLLSAQLALVHGASLKNVAFSLFVISPFLFGLVCGRYLERKLDLVVWIVGFCLIASLAGIALDMFTSVPWKGYSYTVGDNEVSANRAWATGDEDRPAGFARMSTTLSVMLALYSLSIAMHINLRPLRVTLYALAAVGIYLTTNKSTLAAYVATLIMLFLLAYRLPSAVAFLATVVGGAVLPLASLWTNIDPTTVAGASDHFLASFNDRLANSWPNVIQFLSVEEWTWWGAGFGAVGSTGAAFPIHGLGLLGVADNTALYLWATFGLAGGLLYLLWLPLMGRLYALRDGYAQGLLAIAFCLCLVGWATDIVEVPAASLFLGLAIARVLRPDPEPAHAPLAWLSRRPGLSARGAVQP